MRTSHMEAPRPIACLVAEERKSDHGDSVPDRLERAVHPEVREEQDGVAVRQDLLISPFSNDNWRVS